MLELVASKNGLIPESVVISMPFEWKARILVAFSKIRPLTEYYMRNLNYTANFV